MCERNGLLKIECKLPLFSSLSKYNLVAQRRMIILGFSLELSTSVRAAAAAVTNRFFNLLDGLCIALVLLSREQNSCRLSTNTVSLGRLDKSLELWSLLIDQFYFF